MSRIVDVLRSLPNFYSGKPASNRQIDEAEKLLGVTFAVEYREYLTELGDASANGHELTGISDINRIDVVSVTESERVRNPAIPAGLYVIEQTGIDRIVFWQNAEGAVFQTIPGAEPERKYASLEDYLTT